MKPRIWSEIDPAAIRHNARFAATHSGAKLIAVVKAGAYGHGFETVVEATRDIADLFAVANAAEAAAVAKIAPDHDVLLLSPCLPEEREFARECGFIATVSSAKEAAAFPRGSRVAFKVDTGMGRIGTWHEEALAEVKAIAANPDIELHSIATHLPSADEDPEFTQQQLEAFRRFATEAKAIAPGAGFHALNSAGVCAFPEFAFDWVRAGLLLYGSAPVADFQPRLRPALAWKTRVLLVRDVPANRSVSYGRTFITPRAMRIATLAVGYADGYPRQASNRGACVLLGGKRCALLGRVTMDQILVDVSDVERVQVGDDAVLIGTQGSETILAADLAQWAGTIAWHIFTGIGGRTERIVL